MQRETEKMGLEINEDKTEFIYIIGKSTARTFSASVCEGWKRSFSKRGENYVFWNLHLSQATLV